MHSYSTVLAVPELHYGAVKRERAPLHHAIHHELQWAPATGQPGQLHYGGLSAEEGSSMVSGLSEGTP